MKRVKIRNRKYTDPSINWDFEAEIVEPKLSEILKYEICGKPERWQPEKNGDSSPLITDYDIEDVIDSEDRPDPVTGELVHWVKLRAEYTIEIEDITYEHDLAECIRKRVLEYPSASDFLNAFFDGGQDALDELHALRLAIKAKYPKPIKS